MEKEEDDDDDDDDDNDDHHDVRVGVWVGGNLLNFVRVFVPVTIFNDAHGDVT